MIAKNDLVGLKAYFGEHPEELSSVKNANLRLRFTGPAELRIIDIELLVKNGTSESVIIEKINTIAGEYKKFTGKERIALKKMGISGKLITAMTTATAMNEKEEKQEEEMQQEEEKAHKKQNRRQANKAPVEEKQQEAPPVQQVAQQPPAPESNVLVDCVKLAAALKLCDQAGSYFISMPCKAVARSQYNCPGL